MNSAGHAGILSRRPERLKRGRLRDSRIAFRASKGGRPSGQARSAWGGRSARVALGAAGSYFGGEAIGGFADTALNELGLPAITTASGLAFFAGISEYIIVYKAHRRGELGIALSNVFGGMTQVLFLLVPFSMLVIAVLGAVTGSPAFAIPIATETILLMLLLFPLLYAGRPAGGTSLRRWASRASGDLASVPCRSKHMSEAGLLVPRRQQGRAARLTAR